MFNPFTMFFAVPRGDDLETLARRARARYDAMSPADRRAHDEAQRASFVRGNLGVDNPEAADRFEKRRLETVLDNMRDTFVHPSDWPRPARTTPPSTISGYPMVMAEKALSNLIGLPITQEMRDRFYADVAKGQSAYDDAGTTYERHYRAMLGLPVEEPVTHREFVKTVVDGEFRKPFAGRSPVANDSDLDSLRDMNKLTGAMLKTAQAESRGGSTRPAPTPAADFTKALDNVVALQKAKQEVIAAAIAFVDGPGHSAQADFDRLEAATAAYGEAKDALRRV